MPILQPETRGRPEGWDTFSFLSLVQYCPVGTQEAEEPGPWGGGGGGSGVACLGDGQGQNGLILQEQLEKWTGH